MKVAVCALTFRRPEGLRDLLDGLEAMTVTPTAPDGTPLEITVVIVDNDPDRSGEAICADRAPGPFEIRYRHEPRPGIAHGRNTAVAAAREFADVLAFIDDDEVPSPSWLTELLAMHAGTDADIVTGPVLPRLPPDVPEWVEKGEFFARRRHPDGALIDRAYTNNVLLPLRLIEHLGEPFAASLALTGGEDTHLFRRLAGRGAKIRWADRAEVTESVPAERATAAWLIRRMYRVGTATSAVEGELFPGFRGRFSLAFRGLVRLLMGIARWPLRIVGGEGTRVRAVRDMAYGAGLITGLFGREYEEYGDRDKPSTAT